MSRDPSKLKVFELADNLVIQTYILTQQLPPAERFGMMSQIRRAALSVPTNIVEGCARETTREYLRFLTIALGSVSEVRYLFSVAARLKLLPSKDLEQLQTKYDQLIRALQKLLNSLRPKA